MTVLTAADAIYLNGQPAGAVYANGRKIWPLSTIAVDHTKIGENLTDFPLYVDLSPMPDRFWSTVTDGGGDIRCYAGETELAREVVSCNPATKTGHLWIKTDLSADADTVLTVSVDGKSQEYDPAAQFGSRNVWSNGYLGVYHMLDTNDASPNENHATIGSGVSFSPGIIGGQMEAGSVAPVFSAPVALSTDSDFGLSMWTYAAGSYPFLFQWKNASGTQYMIGCFYKTDFFARSYNATGSIILNTSAITGVDANDGNPHHIAFQGSGDGLSCYYDGELKITLPQASGAATSTLYVGSSDVSSIWPSPIGETHASNVVRSSAWIAAEYANQSDPASFYTTA